MTGLILEESDTSLAELESGLILPQYAAEEYLKKARRPKAIDLFAGCGGFSLGIIQAGFDVVAAVDNSPQATLTYMYNLGAYPCKMHFVEKEDATRFEKILLNERNRQPGKIKKFPTSGGNPYMHEPNMLGDFAGVEHFWLGDIKKITGKEILNTVGLEQGEVDVVVGGPPCQGFTTAGKRDVMDPRNSLVFEFIRMVIEIKPKTFVMENVPGMASMLTPDGIPVIDALCLMLEEGGYGRFEELMRCVKAQAGIMLANHKWPDKRAGAKKIWKQKPKKEKLPLFEYAKARKS
jgi:DNA (cytosine-5)-methyltransferase 1